MDLLDWANNLSNRGYVLSDFMQMESSDKIESRIMENINLGVLIDDPLTREDFHSFVESDWVELVALVRDIRSFEVKNKLKECDDLDAITELNSKDEFAVDRFTEKESNLAWLQIDMTGEDDEILEAFTGWLKRTRGQNKVIKRNRRDYKHKKFSQATLRRWHNDRVLPYLDLHTWNVHKGNTVTNKILGDILFPDPKDTRNREALITNTLKPLAKTLISKNMLDRMFKVFSEQSRQNII